MDTRSIIRVYKKINLPKALVELDHYRNFSTLDCCIHNAALAINHKGKRHSHQKRLSKKTLSIARDILVDNKNSIKEIKSFDQLFVLIDNLLKPVKGIGELYIYDTSLRIGSYLDHLPEKVYLHSGTRIGARSLGYKNKYIIEMNELPKEFQKLEPFEVEDILCIFEDKLRTRDKNKD